MYLIDSILYKCLIRIQELTKNNVVWNWSDQCNKAYLEINNLIKERLHLRFYDPSKPAILMTDASFHGFGFT